MCFDLYTYKTVTKILPKPGTAFLNSVRNKRTEMYLLLILVQWLPENPAQFIYGNILGTEFLSVYRYKIEVSDRRISRDVPVVE